MDFFFLTGYRHTAVRTGGREPVQWRVCKDGVVKREGDSASGWVNHEPSGGQISRRRRGEG